MTVMTCYNSSKIRLRPHQSGLDFEDYMGVAVAFPQKLGAQSLRGGFLPSLAGEKLFSNWEISQSWHYVIIRHGVKSIQHSSTISQVHGGGSLYYIIIYTSFTANAANPINKPSPVSNITFCSLVAINVPFRISVTCNCTAYIPQIYTDI